MALPPNFGLLVIGVGQEFRGDDAAGLLIARHLRGILGRFVLAYGEAPSGAHLSHALGSCYFRDLADQIIKRRSQETEYRSGQSSDK